ncbi:SNF1-related protein kinase regulatory subunit gamma 1 [Perilla frutescens var. hirtella]|uniref:SNF1-related protein kinase regulatory subunit gamma 1 n=1 Tax=Perilla frutescens var. hirtella TaxID=608512 RepID=A0AAD4P952_PERFH|nr:SNF1-related protein kinase regulatory subunit gamma 1 [Perilla frutescens var. hirtella]KAH6799219.1 SNF1-related protein kinase regulatory subunit gamma 1 [Perilla frutescens var. frutescens]KAH6807867.1 SNF1-related protein kinase regulatory subunit gamma 1 [Perilla frutescens var. frutescens]KAH6831564.1 SNF1-related protein kinase regulatory subunit gamma 1 [Perilla frutescens var. hirtella]
MAVEEGESTPRSPEAKLGMQVEDLWDVMEPQLSPTEKLNACFESIPVSSFPSAPSSEFIEMKSDTTVAEAVKLLARHKVLGAPVVDVSAPEDASWIDRYLGIVEFAGIVVWILHQSENVEGSSSFESTLNSIEGDVGPAVAAAAVSGMSSPRYKSIHPDSPTATCGKFFETLTASELYKNTKVGDISGSFRWAPFLALQKANSFLTMLLLLSKYRMKSIPVVDLGEAKIDNIITQSAVIHMLQECAGLHWFESWGNKKLFELGLPLMKTSSMVKVHEDEPVLQAFKLMRQNGVGGVPVVGSDGNKAVGNISIRDIQFLLIAPGIYKDYRSITTKHFLTAVRSYLEERHNESPMLSGMVTCRRSDTLKEIIAKLDAMKIHRIYVADEAGNLEGVITLRDIISKLVHEPRGYFGDFFDGVLPLPANSRV